MRKLFDWLKLIMPVVAKVAAVGLTAFLAWSDFYSMFGLFKEFKVDDPDRTVFSLTMACFLEVIPFLMGLALAEHLDPTTYVKGNRKITGLGFWCGLFTWIAAEGLTVIMRLMLIESNHGWAAFTAGDYGGIGDNAKFIGEVFKLFSPILTSMLAFLATWLAFRGRQLDSLELKVQRLESRYNRAVGAFQQALQHNQSARTSLWATLTEPDLEPMPRNLEVFQQQSFIKIREKLTDTCLSSYPTQVERFSSCVESHLAGYILILSQHSTLPQTISSQTVQEIIANYDQYIKNDMDAWNYDVAGAALVEELERALNNAIVVAQFHSLDH